MCCICFGWSTHDELWVDATGQKWDVCETCGINQERVKTMGDKEKDLIEDSSFGTDEAKALRDRAPKEAVEAIVERVREGMEKNK